jgi:AcrR family transcriptional regulator
MTAARRRLSPDDRRRQLLDIGAELFAANPYEKVLIEDVAARAGVSRALMYRYFSSKRDFFAAIFQQASDQLLAATEVEADSTRSLAQWVVAGLDAHFDYFVANSRTILVANRGALAGDPLIQGIISEELGVLRQRMLDAAGVVGHERALASTALTGWLAFVRAVCVEWLTDQEMSRQEVRDMCLRTLVNALGTDLDLNQRPSTNSL